MIACLAENGTFRCGHAFINVAGNNLTLFAIDCQGYDNACFCVLNSGIKLYSVQLEYKKRESPKKCYESLQHLVPVTRIEAIQVYFYWLIQLWFIDIRVRGS